MSSKFNYPNVVERPGLCGADMLSLFVAAKFAAVEMSTETILLSMQT
jgi:hypothetical protein